MRITIVGAGNVGTQLAAHCAEKNHRVTIFSSKQEKINRILTVVNEDDKIIHQGEIEKATSNEAEAFESADLIFVTTPATLTRFHAERIESYVKRGKKICLVPGTGGRECEFKGCLEKGAVVLGVQRVPSVARLVEYGKIVRAVGYRDEMFVAALPVSGTEECQEIMEEITGIKTFSLPNYLNITLTPSNAILHTTRLKNLFCDYEKETVYKNVPLFYEEWNDETSKVLLACDDEIQEICRRLPQFDLSYVKSLREHYESSTAETMTRKIRSIKGFKGLSSPVVAVEGGYIPDFDSRYFTEDFSFGLTILIQIAGMVGADIPHMKELKDWYCKFVGKKKEFQFTDYGIDNFVDFIHFYAK